MPVSMPLLLLAPWPVLSTPRIVPVASHVSHRFLERLRRLPGLRFDAKTLMDILTCFFNLRTLNRSKSVRFFRRSCCSLFFAQLDSAHFLSTSCFSQSFFTGPVPAAFGRLGMTQGVRETVLVGTACRGTTAPSFVEGPSTKICGKFVSQRRGDAQ